MPSIKDLRKRIAATKNTQQTTKAMKMVSAAKLRRSQDAIINHRPYAKQIGALIRVVAGQVESSETQPLIKRARVDGEKKNLLLVLVTSDRGLCGAFNSNIIKAAARWIAANSDRYGNIELAFVGKRGYDFFKTKKFTLGTYYSELGGKVTFAKAHKLADSVIDHYLSGKSDEVKFVYNEFKNVMSQRTIVEDYLPLQGDVAGADAGLAHSGIEAQAVASGGHEVPGSMIAKPSAEELLGALLPRHFAIQAFRIMLESQAGEHGARMSAMESATKNAGEMIRKLSLQYNKQRQAGITKELLEIIAGSESQKNKS